MVGEVVVLVPLELVRNNGRLISACGTNSLVYESGKCHVNKTNIFSLCLTVLVDYRDNKTLDRNNDAK